MQKLIIRSKKMVSITTSILLFCSVGASLTGCAPESATVVSTPKVSEKSSTPSSQEKKVFETSSPIPTPSGTLVAKIEFTCANLENRLALTGFTSDLSFIPSEPSAEARAVNSGGSTCRWQDSTGTKWVTASVEKISPEDYRDFAESLGGLNSPANFGSTNDSLEFFASDGTTATAKILNTSYLVTIQSNYITGNNDIGVLGHKTELLLIGQ